ncbi:cholecystokinin receptor-like [Bombyx mandarina]|uniref:Cholecystokinin receptor-like n=1 Tax=Bombyx mandarina TaxID=7092 RepID=A0A6J2JR66_BOMMA|nr:cholecystokinin receptor-like [Bombyx mandarina]
MNDPDISYNSSLLRMREITSTLAPFTTIRNASVAKPNNAYEWRFILPPYFVIFLLSICGNCLVIATLASNRRMRTVTNVYLLNLAISDFLLGVFCLPFTLVGQIYRRFLFGAALCKLIPFLQAVSVSVDVWTLVAISLERYFAICRPLKSRKWQTQCHAYKMIAMVWILSLILNSPIMLVSTLQPMRGNAHKCREVWSSLELERAFNLGLDAGLLLLPFFIMSFAYCLIVTKLWRGMRHEIQHNFNWQRHLTHQASYKNNQLLPATTIKKSNSADVCCNKTNQTNQKKPNKDASEQVEPDVRSTQPYCMHAVDHEFRHFVRSTHIDKSIEAKRKVGI